MLPRTVPYDVKKIDSIKFERSGLEISNHLLQKISEHKERYDKLNSELKDLCKKRGIDIETLLAEEDAETMVKNYSVESSARGGMGMFRELQEDLDKLKTIHREMKVLDQTVNLWTLIALQIDKAKGFNLSLEDLIALGY